MKIERITVDEVKGKRKDEERTTRFDVKFNIKKLKKEDEGRVAVHYGYGVEYGDGSKVEIEGRIIISGDEEAVKAAEEGKKNLSGETLERIVNAINYVGTTNAVLVARTLGLVPPLRLPILRYAGGKEKEEKK
jgi:hypothetical protein